MKTKHFIIDSKRFSTVEEFYEEIKTVLTSDFKSFGRNLDAFDDILYGGFGKFSKDEKITISWKNFVKSQEDLPNVFLKEILEIIKSHKNIKIIFPETKITLKEKNRGYILKFKDKIDLLFKKERGEKKGVKKAFEQ